MLEIKTVTNGPIAIQPQYVCHDTLPSFISVSLGPQIMPHFASFDQRGYRTLLAREGYSRWAATYEDTIKHDMDIWLLGELQTVCWDKIEHCADLGCGTGRTAMWLL